MSSTTPGPDHAAPVTRSPWVARARKFLVSVAGLLALLATSGLLDSPDQDGLRLWVQVALSVLTAVGVYQTPNART